MKNLTKNLLSIMLACLLFVGGIQFSTNNKAEASGIEEQKIYCTATVEDNFATDSIIVVMKKSESEVNKVYSPSYFENENVLDVEDLTYITGDVNKKKYLNSNNFRQILKLTVSATSKQDVLNIIHDVEGVDSVLNVSPYMIDEQNGEIDDSLVEEEESLPDYWNLDSENGINAENAWIYTEGSPEVKVGIIDSGIAHTDLLNIEPGKNFVDENAGVGYLGEGDNHGVCVAGIISATKNIQHKTSGVAKNVKIVPLVVSKQIVEGNSVVYVNDGEAVVNAITHAISHNIPILNYSGGNDNENIAMRSQLTNYNGLLVCAAGNDGQNNDTYHKYPTNYSNESNSAYAEFSDRVISVGASNTTSGKLSSSSFSPNSVSIFAPGEEIKTLTTGNGYDIFGQTSAATPHVTGVAALLLSINPDLTAEQLKDIIMASARIPVDASGNRKLAGLCVSEGIVNAYNAVKYLFDNHGDSVNLNGTDVTFTKTIDSSETIYNQKAIMLKLNSQIISRCRITITSTNALSVTVRNSSLNVITIADTLVSQDKKSVTISETLPANGVQYLEIKFESATAAGAVNVDIHLHNYTHSYQGYTLAQHKAICDCGEYVLQSHNYDYLCQAVNETIHRSTCMCGKSTTSLHAVSSSGTMRFKPCIGCGYLVDTWEDFSGTLHPGSASQLVTLNGSYVLPNGVISLVNEDIEAYFAGTLKFYKKDELPENI